MPVKKRKAVPKAWQGLHPHRYASDPMEEVFALAWAKLNELSSTNPSLPTTLDHLLATDCRPRERASARDRLVASTIIQWLGSPVGQSWLAETVASAVTTLGGKLSMNDKRFVASMQADAHAHQQKEKSTRG